MLSCQVKLYIMDEEGRLFGKGPYELLKATAQHQSVRQACRVMDLSYSKAWKMIRRLEAGYGQPLIFRQSGGSSGGSAGLTPFAQRLIAQYEQLLTSVEGYAEQEFQRIFTA